MRVPGWSRRPGLSGSPEDAGGGGDRLSPLNRPNAARLHFPQLTGDVREIKSQQEMSTSSRVTEAARRTCSNEAVGPLPPGSSCPENATRSREALLASDTGSAFP